VQVEDILIRYGLVQPGDKVVVTLGLPVAEKAKTNTLRVLQVKKTKPKGQPIDLPVRFRELDPGEN